MFLLMVIVSLLLFFWNVFCLMIFFRKMVLWILFGILKLMMFLLGIGVMMCMWSVFMVIVGCVFDFYCLVVDEYDEW